MLFVPFHSAMPKDKKNRRPEYEDGELEDGEVEDGELEPDNRRNVNWADINEVELERHRRRAGENWRSRRQDVRPSWHNSEPKVERLADGGRNGRNGRDANRGNRSFRSGSRDGHVGRGYDSRSSSRGNHRSHHAAPRDGGGNRGRFNSGGQDSSKKKSGTPHGSKKKSGKLHGSKKHKSAGGLATVVGGGASSRDGPRPAGSVQPKSILRAREGSASSMDGPKSAGSVQPKSTLRVRGDDKYIRNMRGNSFTAVIHCADGFHALYSNEQNALLSSLTLDLPSVVQCACGAPAATCRALPKADRTSSQLSWQQACELAQGWPHLAALGYKGSHINPLLNFPSGRGGDDQRRLLLSDLVTYKDLSPLFLSLLISTILSVDNFAFPLHPSTVSIYFDENFILRHSMVLDVLHLGSSGFLRDAGALRTFLKRLLLNVSRVELPVNLPEHLNFTTELVAELQRYTSVLQVPQLSSSDYRKERLWGLVPRNHSKRSDLTVRFDVCPATTFLMGPAHVVQPSPAGLSLTWMLVTHKNSGYDSTLFPAELPDGRSALASCSLANIVPFNLFTLKMQLLDNLLVCPLCMLGTCKSNRAACEAGRSTWTEQLRNIPIPSPHEYLAEDFDFRAPGSPTVDNLGPAVLLPNPADGGKGGKAEVDGPEPTDAQLPTASTNGAATSSKEQDGRNLSLEELAAAAKKLDFGKIDGS